MGEMGETGDTAPDPPSKGDGTYSFPAAYAGGAAMSFSSSGVCGGTDIRNDCLASDVCDGGTMVGSCGAGTAATSDC